MSFTERYRAQHAEILKLAGDLNRHLTPEALAKDATGTRTVLAQLSGKLFVHLAAEDNVLYSQLRKSADAQARSVAERFVADMQPISKAFKDYAVRWGSARAIQDRAQDFIDQTPKILTALNERIRCEHAELYSIADRLHS